MSNTVNIQTFLRGNKNLRIPQYQRDYSWNEEQFKELWSDLLNIALSGNNISSAHFIGLLVLISYTQNNSDIVDCVDIVDGQQRLTTIFILLSVIRDHLDWLGKIYPNQNRRAIQRSDQINDLIYIDRSDLSLKKRLTPNKNDGVFFDDIMFNLSRGEQDNTNQQDDPRVVKFMSNEVELDPFKIKEEYMRNRIINGSRIHFSTIKSKSAYKAYKYFFSEVKTLLDEQNESGKKLEILEQLKLKIEEGFRLMIFDSKNESDAFNLFETLNNRGLALASVDLIKNKILQGSSSAEREQVSNKWDSIFGYNGLLFGESTNQFLRYLYIAEKKYITKSDLYDSWKLWIQDENRTGILRFVDNLGVKAGFYKNFRDASTHNNDINLILGLLKKTNVTQWYSIAFPLLEIYSNNTGKDELKKIINILWLIFVIVTRFIINEKRFNILEKKFPVVAQSLSESKKKYFGGFNGPDYVFLNPLENLSYAEELLHQILSEDCSNINLSFRELSENGDEIINYLDFENNSFPKVLLRLLYLKNINHGLSINEELTLEHVLPIKHLDNWSSQTDFADKVKYKLGNMLLLTQPLNSEANNAGFLAKKVIYQDQNILDLGESTISYSFIEDQDGWNEDLIMKRTKFITDELTKILSTLEYPF